MARTKCDKKQNKCRQCQGKDSTTIAYMTAFFQKANGQVEEPKVNGNECHSQYAKALDDAGEHRDSERR